MEYLVYIVVLLIAVRVGWKLNEMWFVYLFAEHPDKIEDILKATRKINADDTDAQEEVKLKMTEIEIERVGDIIYAYDKATHQFLAQGSSMKEMLDAYQKRFPSRKVIDLTPQDVQNS